MVSSTCPHWLGNIQDGHYIYTRDFQELQEGGSSNQSYPVEFEGIFSPISERVDTWAVLLQSHPDKEMLRLILRGLHEGFRIGFSGGSRRQSSGHNMASCLEHPAIVQEYIDKELSLGRLRGPFPRNVAPDVHVSPFGLIPKKATGKWRLIVNLSAPYGASINDGIPKELSSLQYVTVDMIADRVRALGRGTLLAKLDIRSAFRIVPVNPADRHLLGMEWHNSLFVDTVLPFGLRSAPKIFNILADAIQFAALAQGIQHITHYLDDFVILGSPGSGQCGRDLSIFIELCESLGVPLAEEKIEGPSTKLEVLGIIIDTEYMQLSLSEARMEELRSLLQNWKGRKVATKREAQSLAGKLQHASRVVRPGRCFVRHIYDLTAEKGGPDQLVRLNREVRSDIQWWLTFMNTWNGISLFWESRRANPDVQVWLDASGSWGCGALSQGRWFQLQWTNPLKSLSIAHKELIPIVIAGFIWGKQWAASIVQFITDNEAVATILNKLYCRDTGLMSLLRCLVFCAAKYNFWFTGVHIPGTENTLADALSRNKVVLFRSQAPVIMRQLPDAIAPGIVHLLSLPNPDWLSPDWIQLFNTITLKA